MTTTRKTRKRFKKLYIIRFQGSSTPSLVWALSAHQATAHAVAVSMKVGIAEPEDLLECGRLDISPIDISEVQE